MNFKEKILFFLVCLTLFAIGFGTVQTFLDAPQWQEDEDGEEEGTTAARSSPPPSVPLVPERRPSSQTDSITLSPSPSPNPGGSGSPHPQEKGGESSPSSGPLSQKLIKGHSRRMKEILAFHGDELFRKKRRQLLQRQSQQVKEIVQQAKLDKAPVIKQQGKKYIFLGDLASLPVKFIDEVDRTKVLGTRGKNVILPKDELPHEEGSQPVVFNPETQRLGLVTGNYVITLKDFSLLESFLAEFPDLTLTAAFKEITLVIITAPQGYNLIKGLSLIQQHPHVAKAKLEIIEKDYKLH